MTDYIMVREAKGTPKEASFTIYKASLAPDLSEHKFLKTKVLEGGHTVDEYVHKDDYELYSKFNK